MPRRPRIPAAVRRQLHALEGERCAYCRSPMQVGIPMVVDHIQPLQAGGTHTLANFCLACYRCNEFKGRRTEARDPETGHLVSLFHPRQQRWADHFAWRGETVAGRTPTGRATVEALRLNNGWLVQARRLWRLVGLHPPLES